MPEDKPTTERPPSDSDRPPARPTEMNAADLRPGDRVARYKILETLGEGGFAVVYLAEQEMPIRRRVALKIIKLGMDTQQVIARFEAERQALAMMNHPGVAKVFDASITDTGRSYFVMEHVPGEPITEYCDRHRLSTQQRLELFMEVCDAVQHAHQKGIVHRDLKPSNVLVMIADGQAVPKVIDFGVAKALHQKLTERTLFTEQGQLIGTPEYMSPEQAERSGLDIDTRSDIYSLGVLLYELLTGALPFDPTTLRQAAFAEIQRIIREVEPPKPSTRLSSLSDESTTYAQKRRADPRSLLRELRGDLDWITMKALEKDRTRRYPTASELAADLARHLKHEPVAAGPPSAAYRVKKYIRRHRVGVTAGAALALALLAGISGTSVGLVLATRAAADAEEARAAEAQQRREAEMQAAIAQAVNDFLNDDLLAAAAPQEQGLDVTMREVLEAASKKIEGRFRDEPLVEASIRATLGSTYWRLGDYEAAEPYLAEALDLRRRELGEERPLVLTSMNNLAGLYRDMGRYEDAQPLYEKTLQIRRQRLGEAHPETLISMNNLAVLYIDQHQYPEAERLYLKTLQIRRRTLGQQHPGTLTSRNNLAGLYLRQQRYDKAEPLYVETLEIRRQLLGEAHPETLISMNNLALLYDRQGRYKNAEALYLETLQIKRRVLGEEHPSTLVSTRNLASLYENQDRYGEAESLFSFAVAAAKRSLPEGHWHTGVFLADHGRCLTALKRYEEGERALLDAHQVLATALGPNHERTVNAIGALADLYDAWGKPDEAAVWWARLNVAPSAPPRSDREQ